jgi:hypothetical protein
MPSTDSADHRLLRAVTRRRYVRNYAIIVVVVFAAIGGVGQLWSLGAAAVAMISNSNTSVTINTAAADTTARVTDFAQTWVMAYLSASKCSAGNASCHTADLSAFYSGPVDLPETQIDATDPQLYSVHAEPGPSLNLQLWSVVVSVAQRDSADSMLRRRVYYQVAITIIDETRPRAATLPAVVPGAAPGVDVKLDYTTVVDDNDPAVVAITGFLRALLAGGPDMSRYVAINYPAQPLTPPPFRSLKITSVHSQTPTASADGTTYVRMLATIKASRAFSEVPMQYPLRLVVADGRWEVAGIEFFPALGFDASEPPQPTTTNPPASQDTQDNEASIFGKP